MITLCWIRDGYGYSMTWRDVMEMPMGAFERALEVQQEAWRKRDAAIKKANEGG